MFSESVEKIIRPKKGKSHILRLIRDMLAFEPKKRGTNLGVALDSASRVLKHKGIVFILSDFMAKDYELPLRRLARRHEVVALWLRDDREMEVPSVGTVLMQDPETGEERYVDTGSYTFKTWVKEHAKQWVSRTEEIFRSKGIEFLSIRTQEDYGTALVGFFARRRSRSVRIR